MSDRRFDANETRRILSEAAALQAKSGSGITYDELVSAAKAAGIESKNIDLCLAQQPEFDQQSINRHNAWLVVGTLAATWALSLAPVGWIVAAALVIIVSVRLALTSKSRWTALLSAFGLGVNFAVMGDSLSPNGAWNGPAFVLICLIPLIIAFVVVVLQSLQMAVQFYMKKRIRG